MRRRDPQRTVATRIVALSAVAWLIVSCGAPREAGPTPASEPDPEETPHLERTPIEAANSADRELFPVPAAGGAVLYFKREKALDGLDPQTRNRLETALREAAKYRARQKARCAERREKLEEYRRDETGLINESLLESTQKRLEMCEARLAELNRQPGAFDAYYRDYRETGYDDPLLERLLLWSPLGNVDALESELLAAKRDPRGKWSKAGPVRSQPSLVRANPLFAEIFATVPNEGQTPGYSGGRLIHPVPGYSTYRRIPGAARELPEPDGGYTARLRSRELRSPSMQDVEQVRFTREHRLHWRADAGRAAKDLANAWVELNPVPFDDWYPLDVVESFTIAPNGEHLVLAALGSTEDGAAGRHDLFVSSRTTGGLWGEPRPLAVNTAHLELSPFLAPDGRTLYFASDRPGGSGGLDIYRIRRRGPGWEEWSLPENLEGVNTPDDEASLSVSTGGTLAFLSAGPRGSEDLYEFPLPARYRPDPVILVRGIVQLVPEGGLPLAAGAGSGAGGGGLGLRPMPFGAGWEFGGAGGTGGGSGSGAPAAGAGSGGLPEGGRVRVERLSDGATVRELELGRQSSYSLVLEPGQAYGIHASAPGHAGLSQHLDATEGGEAQAYAAPLALIPLEVGRKIRLNNIFFEVDEAELLPESRAELDRLAGILERHPAMTIEVAGHTDAQAGDAYNQRLSERRAAAVVGYLTEHGIDAARLRAAGYGERRPVASNASKAGRRLNRRVEFEILSR
jgi:outer membrane protein OmpA-like peptidoglycan-associated protein